MVTKIFLLTLIFSISDRVCAQLNPLGATNNQFAFEIYKTQSKVEGNLFLSPLSIYSALAMTSAGAQKETLNQMIKTLHLPQSYHSEFAQLLGHLKGNQDYQLAIANRIWTSTGKAYRPQFLKMLLDHYHASPVSLDFKHKTEESRKLINSWIAQQTQNKIIDLLQSGIVDRNTEMILTNAIYFKGKWALPFSKEMTSEEDFQLSFSKTKKAQFMHMTHELRYFEDRELQLVEMVYQGHQLAMDVLLPRPGIDLNTVEQKISGSSFSALTNKLSTVPVALTLPKFKAESQFELSENLKTLGMTLPFDEDNANFSGMRDLVNEKIFISKVIHKAFVDISEEGTEAAAATAVIMTIPGAVTQPTPPKIFNANHPFLFIIRDLKTGAILFLGRYSNPA
jgi:serpin B